MILQMMKTKVSIVGDGATGDEYEQHAELQQRLDCYLEMYGVVLNEWRVGITGEKTALCVPASCRSCRVIEAGKLMLVHCCPSQCQRTHA